MRSIFLLFVPFVALAPLACGSTVDSTSSSTSGSGGAGTSNSSTTGGGGETTSSTSTTVTGGGTCAGFIDVTEQGGPTQHFTSICEGSWGASETMTAVGYHFSGGPAPGVDSLAIRGCVGPAMGADGLDITTKKGPMTGTYTEGSVSYSGGYASTTLDPYQLVITKLDGPGGVIEGTFEVTVTGPTDGKKSLKGSFHVCRVADELVP